MLKKCGSTYKKKYIYFKTAEIKTICNFIVLKEKNYKKKQA